MAAWSWAFALVALGSLATGQLPLPLEGDGDPLGVGQSDPSIAAATATDAGTLSDLVAWAESITRTKATDPFAPAGLQGLAYAASLAQPEPPIPTNSTNATTIPGYGNGTNTHYHGNVGDQGLGAIWATVFHGVPRVATAGDIDGDGVKDALIGSDLSVTAVSGASGDLLWARHLGSSVTSVFVYGAAPVRVGYSTIWEGQTARIGILDGPTGAVVWEHIGERPYLDAAPAKPDDSASDIVAVDYGGNHTRLSGADGTTVWQVDVDLLPDDITNGAAPNTAYVNMAHYLAETADLNGDGTTDTISVATTTYGLLNQITLIYAIDGVDGERLWVTNVGGDPHVITTSVVHDITALDTQGDGSWDLAYSMTVWRLDVLVPFPVMHYEQGWRVTKGDSPQAGVPIASRTIVTPELPLEFYPDLDHTDVDGDGRHELACLHDLAVVNPTLNGDQVTFERYAMPLGSATTQPTMVAVSDVTVGAGTTGTGRLSPFDADNDGINDHGVTRDLGDGESTWTVVLDDGTIQGPFATGEDSVRAAAGLGDKVAVATRTSLQLHPTADLGKVLNTFQLRGAPRVFRLGDHDGDATQDLYVLASDGFVHVIDGVTGIVGHSIPVGPDVKDFQVGDITKGDEPDVILLVQPDEEYPYPPTLEGRDGASGKVDYSRGQPQCCDDPIFPDRPLWFDGDGDGILDLLASWYFTDELTALDGSSGEPLWSKTQDLGNDHVDQWTTGAAVHLDGEEGDDLVLAGDTGILLVDGDKGRTLGWYPSAMNSTTGIRPSTSCVGGADGDGDGIQALFAVQDGSAGDVARRLDGKDWTVLDWVGDESDVLRCDLQAVPTVDGREDLLVTMVWTDGQEVSARVGRYDLKKDGWAWDAVSLRPDVESQAYTAFGAVTDGFGGGRVFVAWQDHVFALDWTNGTQIGEFTVNGPFVLLGKAWELDGPQPSEAVILAADGIVWALAEDRDLVASRLSQKAQDEGKPSNYGEGSSFEAPPAPPAKKKDKGFIPAPPAALIAVVLVGVAAALRQSRRGNP